MSFKQFTLPSSRVPSNVYQFTILNVFENKKGIIKIPVNCSFVDRPDKCASCLRRALHAF